MPGDERALHLKLFVGGLTSHDVLRRHVEQFRVDAAARVAELEAIEPTNTHTGHDRYHRFLLDLGLARARQSVLWADDVLGEL